jgi:rfaE bifunctional protein kinase chain/domain
MSVVDKVEKLFASFCDTKVMVIGDVMIDSYIWGKVDRISPEAPVPIVAVEKRENRLGGAANVVLNLKSLDAEPVLCTVIGDDEKGSEFFNLLNKADLTSNGVVKSVDRKTTTKFRVIGNNTQLLRVDEEDTFVLNDVENDNLKNRIKNIIEIEDVKAIIFQDYDKGIITKSLIDFVVALAEQKNIPVIVDPKKRNFIDYKNVTLFKPNLKELQDGLNISIDPRDLKEIESAVIKLQDLLKCKMVMNTLSEGGVFIRWEENDGYKSVHHKAHVRNIADVSGAGDTVVSVAALCLTAGLNPSEMTAIANLAGGIVCEEVGVVPVDKEKLKQELLNSETYK